MDDPLKEIEQYLGRSPEEHWRDNELERVRKIRADAKRPLGINLAEGLALSEYLAAFRGAAATDKEK